ncbi:MAG: hypothetical protein PVG39_09080 [Desulfobacteraceae bacterium]
MKKILSLIAMILITGTPSVNTSAETIERKVLVSIMENYLIALARHDPSAVPLAKDVKLVENTEMTPIGKGLWETATGGPTDFKIFVADPAAGQVGTISVIQEDGNPVILAARLKIIDGRIIEIDHIIVRNQPLHPNMSKVRPGFLQSLKPPEHTPREEMLEIANSYYDAILQGKGDIAPFADECEKRDNGRTSSNDKSITSAETENDGHAFFRRMACKDQPDTGYFNDITDINRRRFIAADEETGLVFVYSIWVRNGEPKVIKIIGVPGLTKKTNKYGPYDVPAAHIFKIRKSKIHEVEVVYYIAEHGIKNGWE